MNQRHEVQDGARTAPAEDRRVARATPVCDVWEADEVVHVLAEMPGVAPGAVEITVEGDVLTIQGRAELPRTGARAADGAASLPVEYRRSFQLTETADADAIEASCQHGLVRVRVPRKKPAQRRIAVSAG
jgi:HSP20 family molecular chaperone IbpA